MTQEKALQALHDENERLGLYKDAYAQPEQSTTCGKPVAQSRPFTKQQRDTLCTVYAIASASTTVNSLPNIAKIVNELLTEDLEVQPKEPEQEPVAHPFEDKSVISSLSWAAGLIEQAYRACGGHNGADSWLMNYADKQGERIRQADHREWEKVNGRWQVKETTPPQRKPLTDEEIMNIAKVSCIGISPHEDALNFAKVIEAVHGIKGEA